ncbi:MAG TPA: lysylphosphatidylglycerol synthase transmembrane domain-containing protein [Candidatus Saccharimonadales bacterium]|jgi:uncharacterized membrane protein YbhN (UPF0104 family)
MAKQKLDRKRALAWRVLFTLALLVAAVYIVVRNWSTVSGSLRVARGGNPAWLVAALLLMALTFCCSAAVYGVLALHRLRYYQTLLVSVAGAFVNRLLPAGLGGLGLNGVYLYRKGHSPAEATVIVSVNNLLGIAAHLLLLAVLLILRPQTLRGLFSRHHIAIPWGWGVVAVAVLCVVVSLPAVRRPLGRFVRHLAESIRKLKAAKLVPALLLSALLTTIYTGVLVCSARSIGINLGLLQLFVVFSFGMLAGTATPTPGGLVGAEAGLLAGFVAYGVPSADAGAAVLLFRLVTYWLPLVPGVAALVAVRKRRLV